MSDSDKTTIALVASLEATHTVASLCVVAGMDVGRVFRLQRGESTIGRSEAVDVRVEDEGVSRHHAKIELSPGGAARIVDLGSTNGTYVNGVRVEAYELREGDHVQIGRSTIFVFRRELSADDAALQHYYEQATRDPLSGLHSPRYLRERLDAEFSFAARTGAGLAVVFVEITELPPTLEADGMARRAGVVLAQAVRAEDVVSRISGLTFALLSRDGAKEGARRLAERLAALLADSVPGSSLGVIAAAATFDRASQHAPDELWRAAEYRLALARTAGRGTVEAPA